MDIVGNLEPGVDFVFNYQKEFNWFKLIEPEGFKLEWLIHPANCHSGFLGKTTNYLQFIGLWKRI